MYEESKDELIQVTDKLGRDLQAWRIEIREAKARVMLWAEPEDIDAVTKQIQEAFPDKEAAVFWKDYVEPAPEIKRSLSRKRGWLYKK